MSGLGLGSNGGSRGGLGAVVGNSGVSGGDHIDFGLVDSGDCCGCCVLSGGLCRVENGLVVVVVVVILIAVTLVVLIVIVVMVAVIVAVGGVTVLCVAFELRVV